MIVLFQPVLLLFHVVNVKSIKRQFPFFLVKSFFLRFLRPSQGLKESLVQESKMSRFSRWASNF